MRGRAQGFISGRAATRQLGLGGTRDATLMIPAKASLDTPLPLLVLLHGASGSGAGIMRRLGTVPEDAGFAVLAPDSRDSTWDAISGALGPDVAFLDRALERVFSTVNVDRDRLVVSGFSDGASYALTLGLINGDLFKHAVAFSPGFIVEGETHGKPRVFVSHGTSDDILPIDQCGRRIVASLKKRGYDVTFREFDGPHTVPPAVAAEAMRWALA
jgi:phospholipase/carboxylesterase